MKSKTLTAIGATALIALAIPMQLAAQEHTRYKLIDLGTFGGPNSYFTAIDGRSLNNSGMATGTADTPAAVNPPFCLVDCFLNHAFLWRDGVMTDLGGLPGVNIAGSNPNDINAKGVVLGPAFNGGINRPIGIPFFDAVVWKDGQIIDLGTFGGPASYASSINDRDQVAGFALNSTPDSFDLGDFCHTFPMPTQMRAFIWQDGVKEDLGTLGGTDSCAVQINQGGQAIGNSFTNSTVNPVTGLPTIHPFLWENGNMVDLGTLGGTIGLANAMNDRGQVVGDSNLAGDLTSHPFLWDRGVLTDLGTFGGDNGRAIRLNDAGEVVGEADLPGSENHHAFLWRNRIMTDLGTLGSTSFAEWVNSKSQVVGRSRIGDPTSDLQHAFLWNRGGPMIDLNTFVPLGSDLTLIDATVINERGEIAAQAMLANGDQRAVLLIPCGEGTEGCQDAAEARINATQIHPAPLTTGQGRLMPNDIVPAWRARLVRRYHLPGLGIPKD